jgi:hypothetical protein
VRGHREDRQKQGPVRIRRVSLSAQNKCVKNGSAVRNGRERLLSTGLRTVAARVELKFSYVFERPY